MKAIILAAGFSTRLYPLTHNFPKGLLPLGGKELAAYVSDDIVQTTAIDEAVLVTAACFEDKFRKWASDRYKDKIRVIGNGVNCLEERLGAIGDLLFALNVTGWKDDTLVATSDTLSSLRLSDFLTFSRLRNGAATAVFKTDDRSKIAGRLGCAVLAGDQLTEFIEKPLDPPSEFMGVPYYFFPKKSLPLISQYAAEGNALDSPGSILSWLIGKTPVNAFRVHGYYYDVGTPQAYNHLVQKFA